MIALRLRKTTLQNFLYFFVFLYFFSVSADHLNIKIGLFKIKFSNAVALFILFGIVLFYKSLIIERKMLIPFGLILLSLMISSYFSFNKSRTVGYILVYCFDFFCYFLIPYSLIYYFNHEKIFKLYFLSFVLIGIYACAQLFLSFFGILDPLAPQRIGNLVRPNAFSYEPSFYALYQCTFVMFYNAMCLFGKQQVTGYKGYLSFIFVNLLLIISTSTGAFFAYLIFFPVSLIFYFLGIKGEENFWGKFVKILSGFSIPFVCLGLYFHELFSRSFLKFFVNGFFAHHSFGERWLGIQRAFHAFLDFPLFGVGIGGVGPYMYQLKNHGEIADHTLSLVLEEIEPFDPVNITFEILGSLGIVGFCCFGVLIYYFWKTFRYTISLPNLPSKERGFGISLFLSLVMTFLVLQFSQGLFRGYIWLHAGMTMGFLFKMNQTYRTIMINND